MPRGSPPPGLCPPALAWLVLSLALGAGVREAAGAAPSMLKMWPDKGHMVGGTLATIYGGGFAKSQNVRVLFSHTGGEVDVVPGRYVSAGVITVVTPPRDSAHDAHVTVSNDGVLYSAAPLAVEDAGTFLYFTYSGEAPQGDWRADNRTGPLEGQTEVRLYNDQQHVSTRIQDANFLPGAHLRCRFGNPKNVTSAVMRVSVVPRSYDHPYFDLPGTKGYAINPDYSLLGREGATLTLVRGVTYTFVMDASVRGHPFYFSESDYTVWAPNEYRSEWLHEVNNTRGDSGNVTFRVDATTPDRLFYHCGRHNHMGGRVLVVDSYAGEIPPEAVDNSVRAVWVNYNYIRCASPPYDGVTDDEPGRGGRQVTVYVSNDGLTYSAGQGGADGFPPQYAGGALTFEYYDDQPFLDAPIYTPATITESEMVDLLTRVQLEHFSNATGGFYGLDAGLPGVESVMDQLLELFRPNDLNASGVYTGDGVGVFEVMVDQVDPDTYRWRFHPGSYNASTDWADTYVATHLGARELAHNVSVEFGNGPSLHRLGDSWQFRAGGGRPAVYTAATTHTQGQFSARGPFEGNTEVTLYGNHFLPSENLKCKLFDGVTNLTQVFKAAYDSPTQARCITPRHDPVPGGKVTSTIRPCLYKTIQLSSDGGATWSTASAMVRFLYCDVYVSTGGSDSSGFGTPDRPYRTLQRAIESALGGPRVWYLYKPEAVAGVEIRGESYFTRQAFGQARPRQVNKGIGYFINRDRIRVGDGTYTGAGNVDLHPLGKVVEMYAENRLKAQIDCGSSGTGAVHVSADRHQGEEAINTGVLSPSGIEIFRCNSQKYYK